MTRERQAELVELVTRAVVKNAGGEAMNTTMVQHPERWRGSQLWLRAEYDAVTAVAALHEAGLLQ